MLILFVTYISYANSFLYILHGSRHCHEENTSYCYAIFVNIVCDLHY